MLTCSNISLESNDRLLFKGLSFTAITGGLIILRGANGVGKTCLLKLICGLLFSQSGEITWNGVNINYDIKKFRENTCFISSQNSLNDDLTVFENLHFWSRYRGEKELFLPAIHYFKLENILDEKFGNLSCGVKRRVELSKLLLFRTGLWLLDEPELNLDHQMRNRLIDLMKVRAKEGGVIIMTTHNEQSLDFANFVDIEDFRP